MLYIAVVIGVYGLHLLLKLNLPATVVLMCYFLIAVRIHRRKYFRKGEQTKRFYEASTYMDNMLYAFTKEQKIDESLKSVKQILPHGRLRELVEKAWNHIHMVFDDPKLMEHALAIIAMEYNCRRIDTIHAFMLHVESYGGEIERPVEILLNEKQAWDRRIQESIQQREKCFRDVVLSAIASVLICSAIVYLPVLNMDISTSPFYQIITVMVLILDDFIIMKAQSYLEENWLLVDKTKESTVYADKMKEYKAYNPKRAAFLSYLLGLVVLLLSFLCFFNRLRWWGFLFLIIFLIVFNQHKIGHVLARKSLEKEIKYVFPNWLLDIVLLLQSENVHIALQRSIKHAPAVFAKEVYLLLEQLRLNPESPEPYHDFLKEFEILQVHSTMNMLYSLSVGNTTNEQKQLAELILMNQSMLDEAEKLRMKDKNSGLYVLFLLPVLTASFKLIFDMVIFIIQFLANTGFAG